MMSPRLGSRIGQDEFRYRTLRRVGELIDQQVIADQQRVFHGARGDDEGLYQVRRAEEQQDDGNRPFGDKTARLVRACVDLVLPVALRRPRLRFLDPLPLILAKTLLSWFEFVRRFPD